MSDDVPQAAEALPRRRRRRRRGSHASDAQHPWIPLAKVFAILAGAGLLFLTGRSLWRYTMYVKQARQQTQEERERERAQGVDISKIKLERIPSTESQMALEALRSGGTIPAADAEKPAQQPPQTPAKATKEPADAPVPATALQQPSQPPSSPPATAPPSSARGESPVITGPLSKVMPLAMLPVDLDSPEAGEAIAALHACESAQHWRDLLPMVRDPERCQPLMRLYYEGWKAPNPPPTKGLICTKSKTGVTDVLHLFRAGGRAAIPAANFLLSPTGKWVLDWESWVGSSEISWEEFRARRTITPTVFRAIATGGSYYNYEFTDSKRYLSARLSSPDAKHVIHAFCERDSPLGQAMVTLVTGKAAVGPPVPSDLVASAGEYHAAVTLRLAFPPAAQSDNCVIITDLVSGSWLVEENEK